MTRLPLCSSNDVIRVLQRNGFVRGRSKAGSHRSYKRERPAERKRTVTVIQGRKELSRGTLRRLISRSGKSIAEFLEVLKG